MISVCMASYNGEKYIREQIDSILKQLGENDELIISDDMSTDATVDIIQSYNDPRIVLTQGSFHSPIFNFENALSLAKGDFIFLSDQDDIWMSDKINKTMQYLKKYDCVVSDAIIVDGNRNIIYESFMRRQGSRPGKIANIIKNSYLGCCMAMNRRMIEYALPFPKDIPMHDIWLGAVAEHFGNPIFIKDKLIEYRRHGDNASPTTEKSKYSLREKIMFRITIIADIRARRNERK